MANRVKKPEQSGEDEKSLNQLNDLVKQGEGAPAQGSEEQEENEQLENAGSQEQPPIPPAPPSPPVAVPAPAKRIPQLGDKCPQQKCPGHLVEMSSLTTKTEKITHLVCTSCKRVGGEQRLPR